MAVDLLIRDGNPHWYLSPDIWVVPGNDPAGPPGSPLTGQPAFLWTRVENKGRTPANGVRIDLYWANPALQVTRSNATFVGSAFADVPAEGIQEALCLVPWVPVIVNNGHECLVAVANHPSDPLPNPLPAAFDPPAYEQVAQKNLTVLKVAMFRAISVALTVSASPRIDKDVTVTAQLDDKLDEEILLGLGLRGFKPAPHAMVEVGLSPTAGSVCGNDPLGVHKLQMQVSKGTSAALQVAIRAQELSPNEYQFVHIIERDGDKILGGLGFVVVGDASTDKEAIE